jgi:hypothetical protein
MKFWRRSAVWFSNFFLSLFLFLLATTICLILTIFSGNYVKKSFNEAGFYQNFTPSVLKLASSQSAGQNTSNQTLELFKPIIIKTVSPSFVKASFENIIDAFDKWLSKKSDTVLATIDVSYLKKSLRTNVAEFAIERNKNLPACTNYDNSQSYDVLSGTCRLPSSFTDGNFYIAADDFVNSLPAFDNPNIEINPTKKQSGTASMIWRNAPTAYKILKISPLVLIFLALFSVSCVLLISTEKNRGWRVVGHTFLWSGGMLLVSGALSIFLLSKNSTFLIRNSSPEQIAFMNELISPVTQKLAVSFGKWALYFGAGYSIVGGLCYFIAHLTRPKIPKAELNETNIQTNL